MRQLQEASDGASFAGLSAGMGFAPENQVRTGLTAGGRWIRTLGPPSEKDNAFRDSSFPRCARATAAFENARRPVQQLLLPVVDPVRMNAELTRQLGDRPVPPTAATTTPSL